MVVAGFAVSLANRWASDEEEGLLDLTLDRVLGQLGIAAATLAAAVVRSERKDLTR